MIYINKQSKNLLSQFFLILTLLFSSCGTPREVEEVIEAAASNQLELERVINHYQKTGDKEKLKAAYFLIAKMTNKYSKIWNNRSKYDALYEFVKKGNSNAPVKAKWDSLKEVHGVETEIKYDIKEIKAELLIENIDLAFFSWKNMPWGKFYNFDQFCEYILPYRVYDEPLQNWRPYLFNKMKWFLDSLKNKSDVREACKYINDFVHKHHKIMPSLGEVPKLGTIDAFKNPAGICQHRLILTISILRTFGIPCALDYTPQYTNWADGHSWIALIDSTGKTVSFSGGDILKYLESNKMPMGFGEWEATKIYRYTYNYENDFYIENTFRDIVKKPSIDVTDLYDMRLGNIDFKLNDKESKYVVLATFGANERLTPVAYSKANNGLVSFKNVALNCIYFPAIFSKKKLVPIENPCFFDSLGGKKFYKPGKIKESIVLTRKFPDDGSMKKYGSHILGSKIQGSNDNNFKTAIDLHNVNSIPYHFLSINLDSPKAYRYVRWVAPDSGFIRLSELEYYSKEGKLSGKIYGKNPNWEIPIEALSKATDGNLYTWLDAPAQSWMTTDFGKKEFITEIKYVQRSRINYVEIGDKYELFYFDLGWKSLGKKNAIKSYLDYSNVPSNSVLLLKDLTKGKQERIFIYKNGKQIWY